MGSRQAYTDQEVAHNVSLTRHFLHVVKPRKRFKKFDVRHGLGKLKWVAIVEV